ncbi:DUF1993 domain-containing protein [Methylobacterium sp. J-048]|uniref:DUF1993 domain-containing protein n=1 Tax=Methylobacterium sp. J-048 TaxID=2836635 RepID=UPI001FB9F9DA|nr:DUF1993 domain-containing protein [Methylobacterium sp. J-048]MCJ2058510.1 DUF1993 domain-containing protein [Methylobacterium sp. J-048]
MYFQVITQCVQALRNVETFLDKAEAHAAARGFDVGVLMTGRLAPDMRNLVYQVQSACDYLKGGAAWLSGQTPPRHADDERTIVEVRARIRKTVAFAESVAREEYEGAGERRVRIDWAGGKTLGGKDYLLQMVVPNVLFHVAMAYAILRHDGVDVGKLDFLGPLTWNED